MEENLNNVYVNPSIPSVDARFIVMLGNISLVIFAKYFFFLQRSWPQIVLTVLTSIVVEYVFFKITQKYLSQKFKDRIPSALTEAAGCLILCRSRFYWMQSLLVLIAITTKYFVKKSETSHIFNPVNMAIIIAICFFPAPYFEFRTDDYAYSILPIYYVLSYGSFAIYTGRVWPVTFGYLSGLVFSFFFYLSKFNYDYVHIIGPELGTSSLIFAFLMITDPKCTPKSNRSKFVFGALVSMLHMILRMNEIVYSRFISLFLITGFFYFYNEFQSYSRSQNEA